MSFMFELLKEKQAKDLPGVHVIERGEGDQTVIFLHEDRRHGIPESARVDVLAEFRGNTRDDALKELFYWSDTVFPDYRTFVNYETLTRYPHIGMDTPQFKVSFMSLDGELPLMPHRG